MRIEPEKVTTGKLLEWAAIEPDVALMRSTRRGGAPITWLKRLLLPACVPKLVYNSILSWVAGWYYLIACEIIVAGPVQVDLPGLGSTLARAIASGDLALATAALATLVAIVLGLHVVEYTTVGQRIGQVDAATDAWAGRLGRAALPVVPGRRAQHVVQRA